MNNIGYFNIVDANQVNANQFGALGGGGAVINASKIILGGWVLEASSDGIYATTPDGIRTKMELIDFRQTPIPETATLNLQTAQASVPLQSTSGPTTTDSTK